MIVKPSEMTERQLDWAVATCEGEAAIVNGEPWIVTGTFFGVQQRPFSPATKWAQGGPIIEREGIDLYCNVPSAVLEVAPTWQTSWRARYSRCGFGTEMVHGPTPLIAAMRCYVASKLGDTVDIPEELCK